MSLLRKIVDEKDARACLLSVARSGETLRAWGKRHGVDGRSLHAWHRNLSQRASSAPARKETRLIELVHASSTTRSPQRYRVHVGEGSVEVGDDFDDQTLRRLLEVLRAC
jgi:transposase-like protein